MNFQRYVVVSVGKDLGHSIEMVDFPVPSVARFSVGSVEAPDTKPLRLELEAARALYDALDRIFGKHEETGVSDVLREALKTERERLDRVLGELLRPVVSITPPAA